MEGWRLRHFADWESHLNELKQPKVPTRRQQIAAPEVTKKLHMYHTLYRLNLSFTNIVTHCDTLQEVGIFTRQTAKIFRGYTQE
jgi:hypothetical protein